MDTLYRIDYFLIFSSDNFMRLLKSGINRLSCSLKLQRVSKLISIIIIFKAVVDINEIAIAKCIKSLFV